MDDFIHINTNVRENEDFVHKKRGGGQKVTSDMFLKVNDENSG